MCGRLRHRFSASVVANDEPQLTGHAQVAKIAHHLPLSPFVISYTPHIAIAVRRSASTTHRVRGQLRFKSIRAHLRQNSPRAPACDPHEPPAANAIWRESLARSVRNVLYLRYGSVTFAFEQQEIQLLASGFLAEVEDSKSQRVILTLRVAIGLVGVSTTCHNNRHGGRSPVHRVQPWLQAKKKDVWECERSNMIRWPGLMLAAISMGLVIGEKEGELKRGDMFPSLQDVRWPLLYLLGVQKSGSTSLAQLLFDHPQICSWKHLPKPGQPRISWRDKEPHFFDKFPQMGVEGYLAGFQQNEKCIQQTKDGKQ
eukprot:1035531-Rhodomonas_salina.1